MDKQKQEQGIVLVSRRSLLIKNIVIVICSFWIAIDAGFNFLEYWNENYYHFNFCLVDSDAPHREEVEEIIRPLRYSYMGILMRDNQAINIDFENKLWYMADVYNFDEQGNIVLEDGRFGVCGALAAYTYEKIKPIFGDGYVIDFMDVAQSGYFPYKRGNHYIIRISKKSILPNIVYLDFYLDPSFHIYGKIDKFEDYEFYGSAKSFEFYDEKLKYDTMDVGSSMPLMIDKDYVLSLTIGKVKEKFDRDNFSFALSATKQHKYRERYLFCYYKLDGRIKLIENDVLASQILGDSEYKRVKERLSKLFFELNQKIDSEAKEPHI